MEPDYWDTNAGMQESAMNEYKREEERNEYERNKEVQTIESR